MSYTGIAIPDGTKQSIVSFEIPVPGGQFEDLVFAAEGVAEQQLITVISSGLTQA